MRVALIPLLLVGFADLVNPFAGVTPLKGLTTSETPLKGLTTSQSAERSADAILKDMRRALGGEAALDAIRTLSMTATGRMELKGRSLEVADEYFLLLPDHYMRVRRLAISSFRSASDARAFEGFRGDELIRVLGRRESPPMVSSGDRLALAKWRHDAARLVLTLTGRTLPIYPLELAAAGTEDAGGSRYETVEARGPEGVVMQLYVDAKTHLPAMVASRGLEKTPEIRWLVAEFKNTSGLNWPRQIEEQVDNGLSETISVKAWKLNPMLDPRTFVPR